MSNRILKFAEENYVLGSDSAIGGRYRVENSPWAAEPLRALDDPTVREVTLRWAAQLGKNVVAEIFVADIIANRPGNTLVNAQTDEDALLFANDRLYKRLSKMPILDPVWPNRVGILKKDGQLLLPHMYVLAQGANDSNLQGKSARYLVNDELHIWDEGMLDQARDRSSAFWDAKALNISTAGDEGSEEDLAFQGGSQETWALGCPECQRLVQLRWTEKPRVIAWSSEGVARPDGKFWNFHEVRKSVRFHCPHDDCNAEFEDSMAVRLEMNRLGEYIRQNDLASPDKRSFHASQIAAPWVPWGELAERWIKSMERMKRGDISLMRNFVIKRLAEAWEDQSLGGSQAHITGGYSLNDEFRWEKENQRLMAVDVQDKKGRHFWGAVRSFAEDGESRLVWAGRINTWQEVRDIAKQFQVVPSRVMVDCRWATKEVLEACALHGFTWMEADEKAGQYSHRDAASGMSIQRPFSPQKKRDPGIGTRLQGRKIAYGYRFSKSWVREAIHRHIMGVGNRWGLPDDVGDLSWEGTNVKRTTYLDQINSWVPYDKRDPSTNRSRRLWKQVHRDDHLRACEEILLIGAALQGLIPDQVDEPTESTTH